jgi:hypothetical protein
MSNVSSRGQSSMSSSIVSLLTDFIQKQFHSPQKFLPGMKTIVALARISAVVALPSPGSVPEMMHGSLPLDENALPEVDSYGHVLTDEEGRMVLNAQDALGQNSLQMAVEQLGSEFFEGEFDGDGVLSYREYVSILRTKTIEEYEEGGYRRRFNSADTNADRRLTPLEFVLHEIVMAHVADSASFFGEFRHVLSGQVASLLHWFLIERARSISSAAGAAVAWDGVCDADDVECLSDQSA